MNPADMNPDIPTPRFRTPWLVLAYGAAGLGAAGTVVPLLPTTPFLLLAVWAATRGSPRLKRRLLGHPTWGPVLSAWREHRAVPRCAKWAALGLIALSWLTLWLAGFSGAVLAATGAFFLVLTIFLFSRPDCPVPRPRVSENAPG